MGTTCETWTQHGIAGTLVWSVRSLCCLHAPSLTTSPTGRMMPRWTRCVCACLFPNPLAPSADLCLALFFLPSHLLPFLFPSSSSSPLLPQVEEVARQANAQEFVTSFEVSPENLVLRLLLDSYPGRSWVRG